MTTSTEQILEHARGLPSPPKVLSALTNLIADDDYDTSELARIIKTDAGLSARLLKVANSAFYGLASRVGSIDRAAVMLGREEILRIAMAAVAAALTPEQLRGYDVAGRGLWFKNLVTAHLAEALAKRVEGVCPPIAFTTGLLLDVGKIGLDAFIVEEREVVLELVRQREASFDDIERTTVGADHALVGSCMASSWSLPEVVCEAIAQHHRPSSGGALVGVIHCADSIAMSVAATGAIDDLAYEASAEVLAHLGVRATELDLITLRALARASEQQETY